MSGNSGPARVGWSVALDPAVRSMMQMMAGSAALGRLSILIFHRVLPDPDALFPGEMHSTRFDELCARLARWFNVLPLNEAVPRLSSCSLPPRALCITFDDGYADNHDIALPILKRYGLTATFFIATAYTAGGCMFNDAVVEAVRRTARDSIDGDRIGVEELGGLGLRTTAERRKAIERLLVAIKYLPPQARADAVDRLADYTDVPPPDKLMMNAAQLKSMLLQGMQIGAHTRTHPILAQLELEQARAEIEGSKHDLEGMLGQKVDLFAYPNGKPDVDYRASNVRLVRSAGFKAAVSTAWGASGPDSDSFQLPRFTPWDRGAVMFSIRMAKNLRVGDGNRCRDGRH